MVKIAFVHPDLGIGGAERLVVDAAVALKSRGHDITMFTSHHDKAHCFEETRDGTLPVHVIGDFLPRHFFGMFHIFFATLRGIVLALWMLVAWHRFDVIVVDQLSAPIPILRLTGAKILFYCHFPDKFLCRPGSSLKTLYRIPFDKLEEVTTMQSDVIVVNSKFTAATFAAAFPSSQVVPGVLYPSISFDSYDQQKPDETLAQKIREHPTIVSINRFERKKNIGLVIEAFARLRSSNSINFSDCRLVVAGGYDPRVKENVEHMQELQNLAKQMQVEDQTTFLPSFSNEQRSALLGNATAIAYSPENEHFGIVPVEAMFCRRPVVACRSGGPTESILDGQTGLLCDSTPEAWAAAFEKLLSNKALCEKMGRAGREHVTRMFSPSTFSSQLDMIVRSLLR